MADFGASRLSGRVQEVQELIINIAKKYEQTGAYRDEESSSSKEKDSHGTKLANRLQSFQKQDKLCNITINIGGRSFHAHKVVLAVASEYFDSMFSGGFIESNKSEVEIKGNANAFEKLLQYAYAGQVELIGDDAIEVLKLACYMQFTKVVKQCSEFLSKQLNERKLSIEDVLVIILLTKAHGQPLDILLPSAVRCLALEFSKFMQTEAFLEELSADVFEEILMKPDVACSSAEDELLTGVIKWLSHDLAKRRQDAVRLLRQLRLGVISRQGIASALEFFQKNDLKDSCKILNDEPNTDEDGVLSDKALVALKRNIITAPVVTGGSEDNTVMYFDKQQCCWLVPPYSFAPSLSEKLMDHRSIVINGELYVAGGNEDWRDDEIDEDTYSFDSDSEKPSARFCKYDPESNSWKELASMRVSLCEFAMVQLGEDIYVIGGTNPEGFSCDVECYNIAENKWKSVPSMYGPVAKPSAVVLEGKIFVYGNAMTIFEELTVDYFLQMYDPEKRQWYRLCEETRLTPVNRDTMLTVHEGKCYRIGFVRQNEEDHVYGKICVSLVTIGERSLRGQERPYAVIGRDQHHVDLKRNNAFCMNGRVFVLLNDGFIFDTGIKETEIGPDGLDEKWDKACLGIGEHIVMFTFNILKLKPSVIKAL